MPSLRGDLKPVLDKTAQLDNAAAEAGRDPAEIRRLLNVNGEITDGTSSGFLRGPVDQWVDQVTDLVVTHGFDTFILWADGEGQLAKFAEEVAPAVREQVAEERA